jgi:hypothetical protein
MPVMAAHWEVKHVYLRRLSMKAGMAVSLLSESG